MNNLDDHVWWEEIPGPRSIMNSISGALESGGSVILNTFETPWLKTLYHGVCKDLEKNHRIFARDLDARDNPGKEPGMYILEQFGQRDDINNYLEGVSPPLPAYIKQRGFLKESLLLVSHIEEEERPGWADFVTKYKSGDIHNGVFLLEVKGKGRSLGPGVSSRVVTIDPREKISIYDILSFTMLLASQLQVHEIWKQYIVWLTSLFFEHDIEALSRFFQGPVLKSSTPAEILQAIEDRVQDKELFNHAAWQAQLQIIFPLVEKLRVQIIQQHLEAIRATLEQYDCEYCGKRIEDPLDAELGFIVFLAGNRWLDLSPEDYYDVNFLRECRNNLAHMDLCSAHEIDHIIHIVNSWR